MSEKGSFASFDTSGGAKIYRIPVEVFPKFWAYAYLVRMGNDRVLVDCGSGTETSHANLLTGLKQAGIQPTDLTHILITHAHIDHCGNFPTLVKNIGMNKRQIAKALGLVKQYQDILIKKWIEIYGK